MTYLKLIVLTLILASCANEAQKESNSVNENTEPASVSKARESTVDESTAEKQKESVITVEGNVYTEYYPGNKNIKFQGPQDSEKRRHGEWRFYNKNGETMSITEYKHGIRDGLMIVKHWNGQTSYTGKFKDGNKVGMWRSYSENGELIEEKDWTGR